MIKGIIIFNNHGKIRITKFFESLNEKSQQKIIRDTYHLLTEKDVDSCNFIEIGDSIFEGSSCKLIYRRYATLYFAVYVDFLESELLILDLIKIFVQVLDEYFHNVCELDLIYHTDKVHYILNEMVMGGIVYETDVAEILRRLEDQTTMEQRESENLAVPGVVRSAVKTINIPKCIKDIKFVDLPKTMKHLKL